MSQIAGSPVLILAGLLSLGLWGALATRRSRYLVLASTLVAAMAVVPSASAAPCSRTAMYIVAHEDDDLLFQSPNLLHDVQGGACVTTVYVSAGDDGYPDSWPRRETGVNAAYANMAGVANTWSTGTTTAAGHQIVTYTLQGAPNVKHLFLRLPDGNFDGSGFPSNNNESLLKLWQNTISSIHPVDGSPAYTKKGLTDTLLALMTAIQPQTINVQDYTASLAASSNDHSDHYVTAYFARAAHQSYTTPHTFTGYVGYDTQYMPQNVSGADLTAKVNAFNAYSQYTDACNPSCAGTQYDAWLRRQYVAASETGGSGGGTTNQAPTANAGPDQTVSTGASVQLDGSGSSDPNGDSLTYRWSQTAGPSVTLSSATVARPTFTAPSSATSLSFRLVVNDGTVDSAPDTVAITVASAGGTTNQAPTADAGPDQTVSTGASVQLDGSGSSDPNGDSLTYRWSQTAGPSVTLSSTTVARPTFTAPSSATSLSFQLVVNDGTVASAPDTVAITVASAGGGGNVALNATATASSQNTSTQQTAAKAIDGVVDGYPGDYTKEWATVGGGAGSWLKLTWSSQQTLSRVVLHDRPNDTDRVTGGTLTFDNGTVINVPALPNDGTALSVAVPNISTRSLTFTVTSISSGTTNVGLAELEAWTASSSGGGTTNQAPTADAGPDQTVSTGASVQLDGSGSSDPNGDSLTYRWSQTAGPSVTLSSATVARPTFTAPGSATSLSFRLVVNDGTVDSAPDTVAITVASAGGTTNQAPTADAGPDQTVSTGASVQLDGSGARIRTVTR